MSDKVKALLSQPFFWLHLIMNVVGVALTLTFVKSRPDLVQVLVGVQSMITTYTGISLANWQAPRRPWTPEEREAFFQAHPEKRPAPAPAPPEPPGPLPPAPGGGTP